MSEIVVAIALPSAPLHVGDRVTLEKQARSLGEVRLLVVIAFALVGKGFPFFRVDKRGEEGASQTGGTRV